MTNNFKETGVVHNFKDAEQHDHKNNLQKGITPPIIAVILLIFIYFVFLNACAMINKSVLPDKNNIVYSIITNCEDAEKLTIYENLIEPNLYLERNETERLFQILNKSMISVGKEIAVRPPAYKIAFYDADHTKLIDVYIKDKDVILLKGKDDVIIGEYSVMEDFYKEFNSVLSEKEFS